LDTFGKISNSDPRHAAFATFLKFFRQGGHADTLIDRELRRGELQGSDRGLFAELVFGALRRCGTLDHIISGLVKRSLADMDPEILAILRLGLYQLRYLDRIPESAAVNESVKLAKIVSRSGSGFVNGVLRNYIRNAGGIVFPDSSVSPAAYIAAFHSHPEWLAKRWLEQLGEEEAKLLAAASSLPPSLTLRVNTLKTERRELLSKLSGKGVDARECVYSPVGVTVEGRHNIPELPGFSEGLFAVQDESSQMAAILLDPAPGERVLDACAAPGGKSGHMAQLMRNSGEIVAADISDAKLQLVTESAVRLGYEIIKTFNSDITCPGQFPERCFDRLLLDAPCSATGVIRRNPDVKWRVKPDDISGLAGLQKIMIGNVFKMLKPGGVMLYSTCSTDPEEDESVVHDLLLRQSDSVLEDMNLLFPELSPLFTKEGMLRTWPHRHSMDGFFAARIRKL